MTYYVLTWDDNGKNWHGFSSLEKARAYAIKEDLPPVDGFITKVYDKKNTIRSAVGIITYRDNKLFKGYTWMPLDKGYYREPQPEYLLYKNGKLGKLLKRY